MSFAILSTAATETSDILPPRRVAATYEPIEDPSEELFEFLATHDPARLLTLIRHRLLPPAHLTFAAELAGRCDYPYLAAEVLIPLLEDQSPVVREGAIYGLEPLLHVPGVREAIQRRVELSVEMSPGVRAAASEALAFG